MYCRHLLPCVFSSVKAEGPVLELTWTCSFLWIPSRPECRRVLQPVFPAPKCTLAYSYIAIDLTTLPTVSSIRTRRKDFRGFGEVGLQIRLSVATNSFIRFGAVISTFCTMKQLICGSCKGRVAFSAVPTHRNSYVSFALSRHF